MKVHLIPETIEEEKMICLTARNGESILLKDQEFSLIRLSMHEGTFRLDMYLSGTIDKENTNGT